MKKIVAFILAFLTLSSINTTINNQSEKIIATASDITEDYNVDISVAASEETVFYDELFYFDINFSDCQNLYGGSFELSYATGLSFEKYEMLQGLGSVQDTGEKLSIEISKKDGFSDGGVLRVYFRAPKSSEYQQDESLYCYVGIENTSFGSNGSCCYSGGNVNICNCKNVEINNIHYCVYNDHAEIDWFSYDYEGEVTIQNEISGVPVTSCAETLECTPGITAINVSDENMYFISLDGVLFNKDATELLLYPTNKKSQIYTVPSSCNKIRSKAFYGSFDKNKYSLQTIEISEAVNSIEESAIYSTDTIFTIKGYANTEAQRYANANYMQFYDLETDEIQQAFLSGTCGDDLTWNLNQDGVMTISGTGMMEQFVQQKNCAETPWWLYSNFIKKMIAEEGVMSISNDAFAWCTNLESVDLPNSLRILDYQAFYACDGLTDIELPEGLIEIGEGCFAACFLQSVKLPESLMYIRDGAFTDFNLYDGETMTGFTSIFIPKNVREVNQAFWGCSNLSVITVDPANKNLCVYDDALYEKGKLVFVPASKKNLRIMNGSWIDSHFYDKNNIESLYIPEDLYIDSVLFSYGYDFDNLESISVSEKNQNYASRNGVLYNKDKSCLIYCPKAYKSNVIVLPESVVRINEGAFGYNSIITDIYYGGSEEELELPEDFGNNITVHYNHSFSLVEGDANNDGVVNVADAVMLQKWLLGSGSLYNWQNVDLCHDNRIDVFDLCLLKRLLIEKSEY